VADLGLKEKDILTFVHQTVYNTGPVKMVRKAKRDGSISASCQKMLSLFVKVSEPAENLHMLTDLGYDPKNEVVDASG